MPLSSAERQRRYRERLEESGKRAEALSKENAVRKKKRADLTFTDLKAIRQRERNRQRRRRNKLKQSALKFTKQTIGKAVRRVEKYLPKSPCRRGEVVRVLAEKYVFRSNDTLDTDGHSKLSTNTRNAIISFYCRDDISWQSPNRKDHVIIKRDGIKEYIPKRFLVMTLGECHALFVEEYPEYKVSLSKFCALRPEHVCLVREFPHNVCLCKYHENVKLLLDCLKKAVKSQDIKTHFREFISKVVCDQEKESCMLGACAACKAKFANTYKFPVDEAGLLVSWHQWVTVEGRAKKKEEIGSVQDCLDALQLQLPTFLTHTFIKRAQSAHFEKEKFKANREHVVIQVDFAENYAIIQQDEIQAGHWSHQHVTLFTACANLDKNCTQSYVVVSDDLLHGKYAVAKFLSEIIQDVKKQCPNLKSVAFFSDGAASQFKQRFLFDNITYFEETHNIQTSWNFFATSHGKGCVDGIGGNVKRAVWTASRTGSYVHDAVSFARVADEKTKAIKIILVSAHEIKEAQIELDARWSGICPLPNTHATHTVIAVRKHVLCSAMYASCNEYRVCSLKKCVKLTEADVLVVQKLVNEQSEAMLKQPSTSHRDLA